MKKLIFILLLLPLFCLSQTQINYGTAVDYANTINARSNSVAMLSETKFVVAYEDADDSGYGKAVIGTVSGSTVSFTGAIKTFHSDATNRISVSAMSDSKFVIVFCDVLLSYTVNAIICTVSGSTITIGSKTQIYAGFSEDNAVVAMDGTYFVMSYTQGVGGDGYAVSCSVSTTTITPGTPVIYNGATSFTSIDALSSTKFVISYTDTDDSSHGKSRIGNISGTTISSYGAENEFNGSTTTYVDVAALSSTSFVVSYKDGGNSNYGTSIIGTVATSTISYGSEYVFNDAITEYIENTSLSSDKFAVSYQDDGASSSGYSVIGDISTTTINYGSEYLFETSTTDYIDVVALSTTKIAIVYHQLHIEHDGSAIIGTIGTNWNNTVVSKWNGVALNKLNGI